ncbi:MAG: 16S rRNA (cytidine(1402)-2'-O)-methyltransferase [Actinomycetales bacterium mxb001]|nr:MAG: 16S rRNA (cytidine(1402)-2'-O)-methyltransferase [Actinomycetales bacterium mxb001]
MSGQGILVLGATPLGNPGDASPRLREELERADVVAAEDTRRLRRLGHDLGVTMGGRVVSLHDAVEKTRSEALLGDLMAGRRVLVVTDAGMPAVSDPGFRLVRLAIDAGVAVTVLPGPSAPLAALVVSGLPVDRFCFEGFLPRRAGERRRRLAELAQEKRTMVFFEAPHRIADVLADMAEAFGPDRQAALCRELTKTYEEVRRGTLQELLDGAEGTRGEITLVIGGATSATMTGSPDDWAGDVAALVDSGQDRRSAIASVAERRGVPRRDVYEAVVRAKHAADEAPDERK